MTTKDKTKNKIVSSLEFEKDPDTELSLPKIPRNKGEQTKLLFKNGSNENPNMEQKFQSFVQFAEKNTCG